MPGRGGSADNGVPSNYVDIPMRVAPDIYGSCAVGLESVNSRPGRSAVQAPPNQPGKRGALLDLDGAGADGENTRSWVSKYCFCLRGGEAVHGGKVRAAD